TDDLAQPLDAVGAPVVGDELEAVHQFVSPAKYLAAARRMSRSSSSLVCSARSNLFSASSRAIRAACDSGVPDAAAVEPAGVVAPRAYPTALWLQLSRSSSRLGFTRASSPRGDAARRCSSSWSGCDPRLRQQCAGASVSTIRG